ncbi:antitoxin YefM [Cupriavidus agavae]|uniref:Antitoxin n=2 Tax=Cupriavidus agavae TaxID=1001822 RepID=A0A4Q7RHI7_9BURK|nr:antitoxin YefM [Cupriavidus agavae]
MVGTEVSTMFLWRLHVGCAPPTPPSDMNVMTFSEARASFKQALDAVCRDHEPTVITRQRGEHVVLISLEDYNSMLETLHLLGSEKNAARLRESIAEFKAGKTVERELLKNDAEAESKEQSVRRR